VTTYNLTQLLLLYIGIMQPQIQTWKHFTRKSNIYYGKKFMDIYFLGLENYIHPKPNSQDLYKTCSH
jgi:hypothetical protein